MNLFVLSILVSALRVLRVRVPFLESIHLERLPTMLWLLSKITWSFSHRDAKTYLEFLTAFTARKLIRKH